MKTVDEENFRCANNVPVVVLGPKTGQTTGFSEVGPSEAGRKTLGGNPDKDILGD